MSRDLLQRDMRIRPGTVECDSPVSMNDRAERESVPPALREVLDLDVRVPVGRLLRPPQEGLLRGDILLSDNDI